jgi:hypothetical protein
MRAMRSLFLVALAAPLGGCFSLTAQKPVPEWAMASQAQSIEQSRRVARAPAQRRVAREWTGGMPTNTGNVAMSTAERAAAQQTTAPTARSAPTNFSPEWYAQEKAADERLRRSMNICSAC